MLEIKDIHTYYGQSYILQGVSARLGDGAVTGILGRNGVGKTTLIRSIIGFNHPRRGSIIFRGTDITHFPPHQIASMGVALVPQGRRIFSSLTVGENLIVGKRPGVNGRWTLERVLTLFPILRARFKSMAETLSGGEQQMLSLGRALMTNAELLLLDEPSEGLSILVLQELHRVFLELKQTRQSILIVEQNMPLALDVADYIYIISKGRIVYECTPGTLWHDTEVKTRYLGI